MTHRSTDGTATHLVCGIDAGQTATTCVLATAAGQVLGRGRGPGVCHLAATDGPALFTRAIVQTLADGWRNSGLRLSPLASLVVGASGITDQDAPEAGLARTLISQAVEVSSVVVCSDARIALSGAHAGRPGIVVIAGTGSIALGLDSTGAVRRAGGWGWLIDDSGSACAIGRDGLLAAVRAADGMDRPTLLTSMMQVHFGVDDLYRIKEIVYAPNFGARGFAALAPLVSQAAQAGDLCAGFIISAAGAALAIHVTTLSARLDFGGKPVPVAGHGGAFDHVVGLYDAFASHIPKPLVLKPMQSAPVDGALQMALAGLGNPQTGVSRSGRTVAGAPANPH